MDIQWSVSRTLLEVALDQLENLYETRKATMNLSHTQKLINGGLFTPPKDSKAEEVIELMRQAKLLLQDKECFDEDKANALREKITTIS